ncbi:hypothetical protein D9M69_637390 [compost metagenome]
MKSSIGNAQSRPSFNSSAMQGLGRHPSPTLACTALRRIFRLSLSSTTSMVGTWSRNSNVNWRRVSLKRCCRHHLCPSRSTARKRFALASGWFGALNTTSDSLRQRTISSVDLTVMNSINPRSRAISSTRLITSTAGSTERLSCISGCRSMNLVQMSLSR